MSDKSIEQIEAELDKEFYEEFLKLAQKYERTFSPKLMVARLKKEDLDRIKNR